MKLPDFIAVGPPRTATTWLYRVLSGHVSMPAPAKEPMFFDENFWRGLQWYQARFQFVSSGPVGEIAPTYFFSRKARERIARLIPNCKIIVSFRDPVERLYSVYQVRLAAGLTWLRFEHAVKRDRELVSSARYAFHLQEWRRIFGEANTLVVFHEDLVADPQRYLDTICAFIGLPSINLGSGREDFRKVHSVEQFQPPRSPAMARAYTIATHLLHRWAPSAMVNFAERHSLRRFVFQRGPRLDPLSPELERRVRAYLEPEVTALEKLVNRDLSSWKLNGAKVAA